MTPMFDELTFAQMGNKIVPFETAVRLLHYESSTHLCSVGGR